MKNYDNVGFGKIAHAGTPLFGEKITYIQTETKSFHTSDDKTQIFVKSNLTQKSDGGNPLAFYERHTAQPDGFAFVAGFDPVLITLTKAAVEALGSGEIVECSEIEVRTAAAKKIEQTRQAIMKEKDEARRAFSKLVGSDAGFENAWQTHLKAKEALAAVIQAV